MRRVILAALLCATAAGAAPPSGVDVRIPFGESYLRHGFEEVDREDGVTVYKHRTAAEIRIAGEGRLPAAPEAVFRQLLDYESHVGTVERVAECRVLARGEDRLVVYQRLSLPVASDRDFTLQVTWGQDGDVRWLEYRALPHRGPEPRDGVIRVTHHQGSWQLKPIEGGRATLARYQTSIDVGGWVPRFLARAGAGDEVPELFESIGRLAGGPSGPRRGAR